MSEVDEIITRLRTQLIIAIATNPLSEESVTQEHEKKPEYYYECYYKSRFFEHPVFRLYPTRQYIIVKQMAGIYADAENRKDYELVIKLMRKGYNAVYQHIKRRDVVDVKRAVNIALRGRKIEFIEEEELGNIYIVIYYILEVLNKEVINQESIGYWANRYIRHLDGMAKQKDQHEDVTKHFNDIRAYYQKYRIKESGYNVSNILDNLIERDIREELTVRGLRIENIPQEVYVQLRSDLFKKGGTISTIGFLSGLFKYFGFSELLLSQDMSKEAFDKYLSKYNVLVEMNNIPVELQETLFLSTMMVFALSSEYAYTREEALDSSEYTTHILQKERQRGENEELIQLRKEANLWEIERKKLKNELKETKEIADKERRALRRTKEELIQSKENEKELIALRQHIFKLQQESTMFSKEQPTPADELDEMKEYLKELAIVVIGGNNNWVLSMKSEFPNFTYIDGNAVNADLAILDRPETIVFFNTDANSHSQYERVTRIMNENGNAFHYISNTTNIDRTIHLMYDYIIQ